MKFLISKLHRFHTCITFYTCKARLTLTIALVIIFAISMNTLTLIDVNEKNYSLFFRAYILIYQNGMSYLFVKYVETYLAGVFESFKERGPRWVQYRWINKICIKKHNSYNIHTYVTVGTCKARLTLRW